MPPAEMLSWPVRSLRFDNRVAAEAMRRGGASETWYPPWLPSRNRSIQRVSAYSPTTVLKTWMTPMSSAPRMIPLMTALARNASRSAGYRKKHPIATTIRNAPMRSRKGVGTLIAVSSLS
jgi:hypothetical protein